MERLHPFGARREVAPIPPVEADTTVVAAGPLAIGVERRQIDAGAVAAHAASDPGVAAFVAADREARPAAYDGLGDGGVSIHVFDAATGAEHLRFDCFDHDPHYHYLTPGSHHVDVGFDDVANGDCLTWALAALAERTPQMLAFAGARELAGRVDGAALATALDQVRALVQAPADQPHDRETR